MASCYCSSDQATIADAITSTMTTTTASVQHVTKASSDKLLSKFAELEDHSAAAPARSQVGRAPVRQKRPRRAPYSVVAARDSLVNVSADDGASSAMARKRSGSSRAEWKALLPSGCSRRSKPLLKRIGIGRSEIVPGDTVGLSILRARLRKTWRKSVERAPRVFIEKHCNTHVQLISDVV